MEEDEKIIQNVQRWLNNNFICPKCNGTVVVRKIRTWNPNKDAYEVQSKCTNCDGSGQGWHRSNGDIISYEETQKLYDNLHNELKESGYKSIRVNSDNITGD